MELEYNKLYSVVHNYAVKQKIPFAGSNKIIIDPFGTQLN
jgi:hypothetical protein